MRGRLFDVLAGDSEEASRIITLDVALPIPAVWQLPFDEHMIAGPGRRNLGVGIKPLDDIRRYVVALAVVGVAAVVEIDTNDGIIVSENESNAGGSSSFYELTSCLDPAQVSGSVADANDPVSGVTGTFVGLPSRCSSRQHTHWSRSRNALGMIETSIEGPDSVIDPTSWNRTHPMPALYH